MVHTTLRIKEIKDTQDILACCALQESIWGTGANGCIPMSVLSFLNKINGLVAGAFSEGQLVGMLISFPGSIDSTLIHWSSRMGVEPSFRNFKVGEQLKQFQKTWCLNHGITKVYWSFDPLESRNAHVNLNKLNAKVVGFDIDLYKGSTSAIHQIGTDRFVVCWDLEDTDPKPYVPDLAQLPEAKIECLDSQTEPSDFVLPDTMFKIKIADNIQQLFLDNKNDALALRNETRQLFSKCFKEKRAIVGFARDKETVASYYIVEAAQ